MIDMKLSPEERAERNDVIMAPQPIYPYGLCISLESDALEKLKMGIPLIDDVFEFKVRAQVTSIANRKEGDDDNSAYCCLQITDMEKVSGGDSLEDRASKKLYGE